MKYIDDDLKNQINRHGSIRNGGTIMYHVILWLSLIFASVISAVFFYNIFLSMLFFGIFAMNVAYNFMEGQ